MRSEEDAEDILQEVWYQLSQIINLEDIESLSGWLFRVARNKITDSYRKKSPSLLENDLFESAELGAFGEVLFGSSADPEDELFKELFWDELLAALEELPENQKEVFIQNELEGKKLTEIAQDSGESVKTIQSRKNYALKHLRKRLKSLYEDLEGQ